MKIRKTLLSIAALTLTGMALADNLAESWDGLVEVKPRRFDAAYLLPGADFRPFTKVLIDPTQVAFHKDWLRNTNRDRVGTSGKVSQKDAEEILATARQNFSEVFQDVFVKEGYEVVSEPGADVLRLSPAVINLYINAPDIKSPERSRTYTMEAGQATLVIEARDSMTLTLLGRVLDRQQTRMGGSLRLSSRTTNLSDFRALFRQWATIATKGLAELKELSPVPTDLKPKQKL